MGKTSKNRRRPDNPYVVEGHHVPQGAFVQQGQALVDSSPQGTVGASLSSSPPPSSVGSVISIPDESPTTPQTFMNTSHFSGDSTLPMDGISSIQTASAAAVAATINTTATTSSLSPGVSGGGKSAFTAWFITEVMSMMHGLGDVKKPLPESAAIVEELVHQQMVSFVLQAMEMAQMRNPLASSQRLDAEDCLFLMRKNRVKLKRLYRFVLVRDLKEKAHSSTFDPEEEVKEGELPPGASKNRLKNIIKSFVRSIDDSACSLLSYLDGDDDLDDVDDDYVDGVKMERLRRAEIQSRRMSVQQYMEFTGARGVSFGKPKAKSKLREWLFLGSRHLSHLDVKVDSAALDIICYLAKETVAEIVDLSILVQQEALVRIEDPTSHVRGIPSAKKLENPVSSTSSSNSWDGVNIPGLGSSDEKTLSPPHRRLIHGME